MLGRGRQNEADRLSLALTIMADVSVALCSYNGAAYIREQLESIATQTLLPAELIVCDDRSSDATRSIVEAFARNAPFAVRVFVNERNLGVSKNFERAIALCDGDYIALSDQDDVWYPDKLERMSQAMERDPRVGLGFSEADVVDRRLQPLGVVLSAPVGLTAEYKSMIALGRAFDVFLAGNRVTGATMMFRSSLRELVLPIFTGGERLHDGWIALLLAAVADVIYIDSPLMMYRHHGKQEAGLRGAGTWNPKSLRAVLPKPFKRRYNALRPSPVRPDDIRLRGLTLDQADRALSAWNPRNQSYLPALVRAYDNLAVEVKHVDPGMAADLVRRGAEVQRRLRT